MPAKRATHPNKALWERGDFTRIAAGMRDSGEELVRGLGLTRGTTVLDLGCGDGTTTLPAARAGADVLGIDIARNLVAAGNRRAAEAGLWNVCFIEGDACNLRALEGRSFDVVVSLFGAMFASHPQEVAAEMVRLTRPGGRIVMGNWIPDAPTLVTQVLKATQAPDDAASPMAWGEEEQVVERFAAVGVAREDISFQRDTCTFRFDGGPAQVVDTFRRYDGPTMNAFEAAAQEGRTEDLRRELEALVASQDRSTDPSRTVVPASFLRVTARVR